MSKRTFGIVIVGVAMVTGAQAQVWDFERANGYKVGEAGDAFAWTGTGGGGSAYLKVDAGSSEAGLFTAGGWTVTGTTGQTGVDLVKDSWSGTPNSQPGDQWVDLAGSPGPGGISRTVKLFKGNQYKLTWDSFRSNSAYAVDVALGSLFTTSLTTALDNTWQNFSSGWITPVSSMEIMLTFATPQGGSGNVGLDNVNLTSQIDPNADPVPEPFTLALGAAGLLAAARRRRNRA